jgi:hypothetical protein
LGFNPGNPEAFFDARPNSLSPSLGQQNRRPSAVDDRKVMPEAIQDIFPLNVSVR